MSKSVRRQLKSLLHRYGPGMISCRQFEDFVVEYFDETLSLQQRTLFDAHIKFCRECRDYLMAYRQTIALGKAAFKDRAGPLPDDVPKELVEAILAAQRKRR